MICGDPIETKVERKGRDVDLKESIAARRGIDVDRTFNITSVVGQ